jgi:hypothetical protein
MSNVPCVNIEVHARVIGFFRMVYRLTGLHSGVTRGASIG